MTTTNMRALILDSYVGAPFSLFFLRTEACI